MSFCRMGVEGSSVYVIQTDQGYECCFCGVHEDGPFGCTYASTMISHLRTHESLGDTVPDSAYAGLCGCLLHDEVVNPEYAWLGCGHEREPVGEPVEIDTDICLMVTHKGKDYGKGIRVETYTPEALEERLRKLCFAMEQTIRTIEEKENDVD